MRKKYATIKKRKVSKPARKRIIAAQKIDQLIETVGFTDTQGKRRFRFRKVYGGISTFHWLTLANARVVCEDECLLLKLRRK